MTRAGEMDLGTPLQRTAVEKFMPYSFIETNELAKRFQKEERRHVYSTPKSFLEMLKLYQVLLEHKRDTSDYSIGRLKAGLQKMQETADAVAEIEAGLKITLEDAEVKKTKAEGIAEVVGKEKAFLGVPLCIQTTRGHRTRPGVVSFSSLSEFGPRR